MIVKIEPTGCCERKGLMQIRFSFYLEPGEHGYNIHHMPDGTDNPFHNHFVYCFSFIPDEELMDLGEKWCRAAYRKWVAGERMRMGDKVVFPENVMARHRRAIADRLEKIKSKEYVRQVTPGD